MRYSIDPISADCYEGTTCLINKFGIKDEKKTLTNGNPYHNCKMPRIREL